MKENQFMIELGCQIGQLNRNVDLQNVGNLVYPFDWNSKFFKRWLKKINKAI